MSVSPAIPRVLITGVTGFVGAHLVRELRAHGATDIFGIASSDRRAADVDEQEQLTLGAPGSQGRLDALLRHWRPHWIFHLAGRPHATVTGTLQANTLAATQMLDAVTLAVPDAMVLVLGSAAEYGTVSPADLPIRETHDCHPESSYGIAKHAQTLLAQEAARRGMHVVIARAFNLIGAGVPEWLLPGALLARARAALVEGKTHITVGNVNALRDYLAVEDAARALVDIIRHGAAGEIFNVCSGEPRAVKDLVDQLLACFPTSMGYHVDAAARRSSDPAAVVGDASKLRALSGWRPRVPFDASVRAAYAAAVALEGVG